MNLEEIKAAILVVGEKTNGLVSRLENDGHLTYSSPLPEKGESPNGNNWTILRSIIERDHPDVVVISKKKEEDRIKEVYSTIKDLTANSLTRGVRVVVPVSLTSTIMKTDPDDSYILNTTDPHEVSTDVSLVWSRLMAERKIPKYIRTTQPKIYVVTGVTCAGKTTSANRAAKLCEHVRVVVKHRAGGLRPHDIEGLDYIVRSEKHIQKDIEEKKLIGYNHYGRTYGVPISFISKTLNRGEDAVVVVAETDAVEKIINHFGKEIVRPIYLYTTAEALENRLAKELGKRPQEEIRQRLAEIREKELISFKEHPELITWFVPNFNPPYPEDSKDFSAAKQKYWDNREIARAANWIARIWNWEHNNEVIGKPQEEFERAYTDSLIIKLFGHTIDKLIEKLSSGKEVKLVTNGQLHDYVKWLREEQGQEVDIDHVRGVVEKRVLYASTHPTLGLFFEPYMDTTTEHGIWSDKELMLGYIEKLAGPSVHRNYALSQLPFSAFGGCILKKDNVPIGVDDGLFYALSLPPSSVEQKGGYRRLAISFFKVFSIYRTSG